MKRDAFSACHPAVNFLYFLAVLLPATVIVHPAFLTVGFLGAACYYLCLFGLRGLRRMAGMLPLLLAVALVNPLFNRSGQTVLLTLFGIPYTREALCYGAALALMFWTVLLWFGCCTAVLRADKFTALFASLAPSLSLLLVMIFRLVPNLKRKGAQIMGARRCLGKTVSDGADAAAVLRCLTAWALEGGVATADSMRCRGYGAGARTGFMVYTLSWRDRILLGVISALLAATFGAILCGQTAARFTPEWYIAPTNGTFLLLYGLLCFLPTLLRTQEAISWHISKFGI